MRARFLKAALCFTFIILCLILSVRLKIDLSPPGNGQSWSSREHSRNGFFLNVDVAFAAEPALADEVTIPPYLPDDSYPYQWVELSSSNLDKGKLELQDDDSKSIDLAGLGFSFFFFGEPITKIEVSSNGYITFGNNNAKKFTNDTLVDTSDPNKVTSRDPHDVIAPFWDDLGPASGEGGGSVYYLLDKSSPSPRLIVEWYKIPVWSGNQLTLDTLTFEVIFYQGTNQIVFQYKDATLQSGEWHSKGCSATVGLKYHDQIARQYSYNKQEALHDSMAISFSAQTSQPHPEEKCTRMPAIVPISPMPDQGEVSRTPDIILKVKDLCLGADLSLVRSLIHLYVDGNYIDNTQITWSIQPDQVQDPSLYLPDPNAYLLTYHHPLYKQFAYNQTVSVKVMASDQEDPAREPSLLYQSAFTTLVKVSGEGGDKPTCDQPPVIENISPIPNSIDVSVDSKITMDIKAACSPIDENSIHLTVDGQDVSSDAFDIACSKGICTLSYEPVVPFECSVIVPVEVEARDQVGNKATQSYFLYIKDSCKPYIESSNPDQRCISANTILSFTISDIGYGVDPHSLQFIVDGKEDKNVAVSASPDGRIYTISYNTTVYTSSHPFQGEQRIPVKILAKDLASPPNVMEANFEYAVCCHEWTHYLLNSQVSDLALDKKGKLWVATLGAGLFTYSPKVNGNPSDPDYWTDWINRPYTDQNGGLPSNFITRLAVDHQGYIWLCSQPNTGSGGGIAKFDPSTGMMIKFFQKGQNGLPDDLIQDMAVDPNDANDCVWIATQRYGVLRLQNQQWQVIFDIDHGGLADNWVKAIALDNEGNKWIGTIWGNIYKFNAANQPVYNGGSYNSFPFAYGLSINSLIFDPVEDTLWVATSDGAYQYHNNLWSQRDPDLGNNSINSVFSVAIEYYPSEKYWFATDDGIFATTDWNSWTSFTMSKPCSPPTNSIRCIKQDTYGNLWFGTDNGISRLDIIPPMLTSIVPKPDSSEVDLSQSLTISFNEPMDWTSLLNNITVSPDDSNFVIKPLPALSSITFIPPKSGLIPKTTYRIIISDKVMDASGNRLSSTRTSSFTTKATTQSNPTTTTPPQSNPITTTPPQSNTTITTPTTSPSSWWWENNTFGGQYGNLFGYSSSYQLPSLSGLGISNASSLWTSNSISLWTPNNYNWYPSYNSSLNWPSSYDYFSNFSVQSGYFGITYTSGYGYSSSSYNLYNWQNPQLTTNYGTSVWSNWLPSLSAH